MTIPNLPTDSLYKFVALTGVLMITLSTYFIHSYGNEALNHLVEVKEMVRFSKLKQKFLTLEMEAIKDKSQMLLEDGELMTSEEMKKELFKIDSLSKNFDENFNDYLIKMHESDTKSDIILTKFKIMDYDLESMWAIFYFGAFFMLLGFSFWYGKVQYYQDIIIKGEAEKYLKDISPKMHRKSTFTTSQLLKRNK